MRYRRYNRESDSWKSLADIFSGLTLMFMLMLILIVLFVGYRSDLWDVADRDEGGGYSQQTGGGQSVPTPRPQSQGGGNGGGQDEPETTPIPSPTVSPGPEPNGQDGTAAVRVVVKDAVTEEVIEAPGMEFSLLTGKYGARMTLHTYYPDKISYVEYETREDGTFYLPEKLHLGTFALKNLSVPAGYVGGTTMEFSVPDAYDWGTPLVVEFPLEPIQQVIALRVTDRETGEAVGGGIYDVIASEDIQKADGSYYARKGDALDTIVCDDSGYGQSVKLPPADHYALVQTQAPEFYAVTPETVAVTMEAGQVRVQELFAEKSRICLFVVDELDMRPIPGVAFEVKEDTGAVVGTMTTGGDGKVYGTDLKKNTRYVFTRLDSGEEYTFAVDQQGRINGGAVYTREITERIIRLDVSCVDSITGMDVSGVELRLRDMQGNLLRQWTTGNKDIVEGLTPGSYLLETAGRDSGESVTIYVEDTAQVQTVTVKVFRPWVPVAGGIVLLAVVGLLGYSRSKRKMKEKEGAAYAEK